MTKREWQRSRSPWPMIEFLGDANERKLKLFSCACCRRAWDALTDPRSSRAVEVAERAVEGLATDDEVNTADNDAADADDETGGTAESATALILLHVGWQTAAHIADYTSTALTDHTVGPIGNPGSDEEEWEKARLIEEKAQVALVRDIFGNPFHPSDFSPSWRTDTAMSLTRGMYESRDFSAMPILADALQDAGCDNEHILGHCRGTNTTHVRGCWVVDLVLGKE